MANATKLGNVTGTILGKVVFGAVNQKETNAGKIYEEFNIGIQLPNGSTVFVRNRVWEATRANANMSKRVVFLEDVIDSYKSEDLYVSLRLKPDATTGENKFANFSTYINKEGKIGFTGEGFLDPVETEVGEDGEVRIVFTNAKGESYTRLFKDFDTDLTFQMYVGEINGTVVTLIDGKEQYGNKAHITVPGNVAEQLVLGQMYAFKTKFAKGAKIEASAPAEVDEIDSIFSFADDFKVESLKGGKGATAYETDRLDLVKGGIIREHKIEIEESTSSDSAFSGSTRTPQSRVSVSDDLPF